MSTRSSHPVRSAEQWQEARLALLAQEKQFTRLRDQLSEQRRALPWQRIERDYTFIGSAGPRTLGELFGVHSQLLVYHFMFAPEWEAGCKSCSFWMDNLERNVVHLAHRDVSFAAISRAPIEKLSAYKQRMRWTFPWFSSGESSFNYDFAVSFTDQQRRSGERVYNFGTQSVQSSDMPGFSVFHRDASGAIYRTYACYSRGIDMMNSAFQCLDLVPKGRDESQGIMTWLRRWDEYDRQEP